MTSVADRVSPKGPKPRHPWGLLLRLARLFWSLDIAEKFLIAGGAVLSCAMAGMGVWSSVVVSDTALRSAAIASSTFMDLVIEPNVQQLYQEDILTEAAQDQLDRALREAPLDNRIVSVKIWRLDGTVLYSTHRAIVGRQFASEHVARAAAGEVFASYDRLDEDHDEAAFERATGLHIIEVYAPLHHYSTGKVIAVGEYYENAQWFEDQLDRSRLLTWAVVGLTTLVTLGALFLIVRSGSATIARQRHELRDRVHQAETMAHQNDQLRLAAEKDRHDAVEANEQLLSNLGSDLHDGPIQLLSVVALKMSMFRRSIARLGEVGDPALDTLRMEEITSDALDELRNLSLGLILPDIENMPIPEALLLAVERHRDVTGAVVATHITGQDLKIPRDATTCAYRVVQESLNNANRHAHGSPVAVTVTASDTTLRISVADSGPGIALVEGESSRERLGLTGLRNRVRASRGTIEIVSAAGQGTEVIVELPLG